MGYTHTIFSTPKLHEVKHSLEKKSPTLETHGDVKQSIRLHEFGATQCI